MARLQLDLSETHDALLEKIQQMCDLKTKKDVVENALMLLGWAATASARGYSIAAIDEENKVYREIETPALQGARAFNERQQTAGTDADQAAETKLAIG